MKAIAPLIDMPTLEPGFRAAVIVSRRHVKAVHDDALGFLALETLQKMGVSDLRYREQPSQHGALRRLMLGYCDEGLNLVLVLGGTVTAQGPKIVKSLAQRQFPWVPGAVRYEGNISRSPSIGYTVVAARKKTLLAAVPGSLESLRYALKALTPHLFDAYLDVLSSSPEKQLAQAA